MHVFVRDWLSANNILLKSRDGHVLIDSGYVAHAPLTLALLRSRARSGRRAARAARQHARPLRSHRRQRGGAATPTAARSRFPRREAPLIERWDTKALLLDYADQHADRFAVDERAASRDRRTCGATSNGGCSPRPATTWARSSSTIPEHRILISGDALWENGYGFVDAAGARPRGAAGDARHARHDRRPRRARRDPRPRRRVHRRRAPRSTARTSGPPRSRRTTRASRGTRSRCC